jgi:hypothetical protein
VVVVGLAGPVVVERVELVEVEVEVPGVDI